MANVKISELSPLVTVQDADVLPIVDNAITKKVTAAILRSYTQGNSVLLTGAQTIAGIKTFTAQLASSVATGTAPFSVASTTKVTNLNADLLDGLSSADFQAPLSGTGIVKSTAGTISYLTDNSSNWNTAFNDSITSAAVTGTTTKTLTLNQQDGGSVTASWTDDNTDAVTSVFGRTGAIVATSGDYTTTQVTEGTNLYFTDARARAAISLTTTGTSGVATYVSGVLNIPNYGSALSAYVPYTGATTNVNLGTHSLTASDLVINHASGSGVAASISKGGAGEALTVVKSSGSGNAASITGGTTLISELNLTTDLADAYIASAATWNAKQNAITLTTTGTSGAATLVGATLNIPQYQSVLTNPITGTGTTNYLPKFTGASALGNSNLVSDAYGQLGLGVTPSAWDTSFKALQIGIGTSLYNNTSVNGTFLGSNFYYNGTDNKYIATGTATAYGQINGSHNWFTVASGTAGDTVNFTQAMKLDTSGNLVVGDTTGTNAYSTLFSSGIIRSNVLGTTFAQYLYYGSTIGSINTDGSNIIYNATSAFSIGTGGTTRFTIASGGAATFSSSVTTGGDIILGDYATATTKVLDLRTSNSLFTIATDGTAGSLGTLISYSWANGGQGPLKFNNAAGEVMRLSAGGNVLIGTTTDSGYKLDVNGTARVSGNLQVENTTSLLTLAATDAVVFQGIEFRQLGNLDASIKQLPATGEFRISNGRSAGWGGFTTFYTDTVERMRITDAGGVRLQQGLSLNSATAPASGIEFPATQVASASANNLDDYEEGTFTPSIAFGGASVGITYFDRQGNYVKIGKQVTCTIYLAMTNVGTSVGNATIEGLPFTSGGANRGVVGAASFRFRNFTTTGELQGSVGNSATNMELTTVTILGVQTALTNANFSSASEFNAITVTYFV
jgi:hypothetical protein